MGSDDIPAISPATDSTRIDLPAKAPVAPPPVIRQPAPLPLASARPAVPPPSDPRKASELRRPAPPSDPRNASDLRRPATVVSPPKAIPGPVVVRDDEDPEKLLREYADRQKTKVNRMEGELVELRKVAGEREQYRVKWEMATKDLQDARAKLEAASKLDTVIRDLQGKIDAAILSNAMLTDENGKLKAKGGEFAAAAGKNQERAATAEKSLADVSRALAHEKEVRRDAEGRIAAAAQALQPRPPAAVAPPKK